MSEWYYIVLLIVIILLWVVTGRFEWHLPTCLAQKIDRVRQIGIEKEAREAFILNFETKEFGSNDIEKEVYIIRKSRKGINTGIILNVGVKNTDHLFDEIEREKAKLRLERRFPGLTVNFTKAESKNSEQLKI